MQPLRIGVLGAARIVSLALLQPARGRADVVVSALAARNPGRAQHFCKTHGIARPFDSYKALLADPDVDAIYIPLPNGLHGRWTMAALEAGKHVLCEKPFTANAQEADAVRQVARRTGLVCMEAFHYRYHALTRRLLEIVASGELGEIRRIETCVCIPLLSLGNIRWDLGLAGGTLMDVGCYAIHMLRTLAGSEPVVRSAQAKLLRPHVDRWVHAELEFGNGRTGSITVSMLSTTLFKASARVIGSKGTLDVSNPLMPQLFHRIRVRTTAGTRAEKVERKPSTYAAQLSAFVAAVRGGESFPTNVDDAVANMQVIDACYRAAGLSPREPTRRGD